MLTELYFLDIKQMVSTWLELMALMLFAMSVSGNISMTYFENIGMREHLHRFAYAANIADQVSCFS